MNEVEGRRLAVLDHLSSGCDFCRRHPNLGCEELGRLVESYQRAAFESFDLSVPVNPLWEGPAPDVDREGLPKLPPPPPKGAGEAAALRRARALRRLNGPDWWAPRPDPKPKPEAPVLRRKHDLLDRHR